MKFGVSVVLGVYSGVVDVFCGSNGITFCLDDGTDIVFYYR